MNNLILDALSYIIAGSSIVVLLRGILNLYNLQANLSWLSKNKNSSKDYVAISSFPPMIVCIPMLREQRIARKTIEHFSNLQYPKGKYQLVIVTTEKENLEKKTSAHKINAIYKDLIFGISLENLTEKYLGIFSEPELIVLYNKNKSKQGISINFIKDHYKSIPSTQSICIEEATRINKKVGYELIKLLHYPNNHRTFSSQLNYVIDYYKNDKNYADGYIAFYNADSHPNNTILLDALVTKYRFEKKYQYVPQVMQQSSLFTLNYGKFKNNINGYLLKSASLFQTKWTLIHELSILRNQSATVVMVSKYANPINYILYSKLGICIGHGLFLSTKILRRYKMPTDTVTEDLPLGYYISCINEPIVPIPALEISESPLTIKSLFNQKRVWFWPYLQYELCKERVLKHHLY